MDNITRKELAAQLKVSYDTLVRNETEWGLFECRIKISKRPILYDYQKAVLTLRQRGAILKPV
jgi:hypothetical protein